jgi:hypothetical protein
MSKLRTVSRLALFFLVLGFTSNAIPAEKMTPSGTVSIETKSIAAGIGVTWGDGKLSFKGKEYPFTIDGLTLVDFGFSKVNAVGMCII